MQIKTFESGGFVIHKAAVPVSPLVFSLWCDERGQILDVEAFRANGKRQGTVTVERMKGEVGQAVKLLCFRAAEQINKGKEEKGQTE